MKNKPCLAGLSRAAIADWCAAAAQPKFRAAQIADWIYRKLTVDPQRMSNLPEALRQRLAADFAAPGSRVAGSLETPDGTRKLLIALQDGENIEMVVIPGDGRITFCLSTQVGCPVGCRFCASGAQGLKRNLAAGEILEELLHGAAVSGGLPDNIVFMGIGEGLLNFNELSSALERLSSPEYFGMSPRRLTVSSSGYVPGIRKLAGLGREYTLAISLHAPNDEIRAKLIPDPLRYPVAEILAAADEYREKSGRMVTLEYTLLAGCNDSEEAARELARLARRHHAKVNLIPYNETNGLFRRPERRVIERFHELLLQGGATATVRVERGSGAAAACGQLRLAAAGKGGTQSG